MAMRRPRIKATALLTTKRKSRDVKSGNDIKSAVAECSEENAKTAILQINNLGDLKNTTDDNSKTNNLAGSNSSTIIEVTQNDDINELNVEGVNIETSGTLLIDKLSEDVIKNSGSNDVFKEKEENKIKQADSSFKCPARVEYVQSNSQTTSNTGSDDVFYSDMEESILQSDLQKTASDYVALPSKQQGRQRIRPVPTFPRRNSLVGIGSPSQSPLDDVTAPVEMPVDHPNLDSRTPETVETNNLQKIQPITQRRERHYSASMAQSPHPQHSVVGQHHYTPQKFTPAMGLSRTRTESNCSAFSDSFVTPSKLRKTDEHNNRTNSRRDVSFRIVNGNLDKSSLKMFDLIYYNPVTNPMEKRNTISTIKKEPPIDENDTKLTTAESKVELADGTNNAMPVPQLKLNANGDLILDEKTLEIETTAEQEARKVLANSSLIFLDENTGMNGFYKRQKRTKDWPPEETIKFYRCLQTVGTDFSLMCQLFPKRTRRDLKLKFKKEERNNLALINKALLYPKLFNIDDLKTQLETEEREREEAIQRWKEIHEKEAKTIKKVKINSSTAARALKNGDDIYENENVVKRKLSRRSNATEKQKTDSGKKPKTSLSISNEKETVPQQKHKRKKHGVLHNTSEEVLPNQSQCSPTLLPTQLSEVTSVKLEVVHAPNDTVKAEHLTQEANCSSNEMPSSNVERNLEMMRNLDEMAEEFINIIAPTSCDATQPGNELITPNEENCSEYSVAEVENKTFVDLDDGTVNTLQGAEESLTVMDVMPATPSSISQREVDECDIQQILMDLADGSLVLVSTLDPDNADQVVNEIYMMDKVTGELCEKPLDIPESIVQCVLSVMN